MKLERFDACWSHVHWVHMESWIIQLRTHLYLYLDLCLHSITQWQDVQKIRWAAECWCSLPSWIGPIKGHQAEDHSRKTLELISPMNMGPSKMDHPTYPSSQTTQNNACIIQFRTLMYSKHFPFGNRGVQFVKVSDFFFTTTWRELGDRRMQLTLVRLESELSRVQLSLKHT